MTKGLSHPYHLDESTFILRGFRSDFSFLFHFSMKIKIANRIAPDGTPRFAASHLGLFCLPLSHKKDARFIWLSIKLAQNERSAEILKRFVRVSSCPHSVVYLLYIS